MLKRTISPGTPLPVELGGSGKGDALWLTGLAVNIKQFGGKGDGVYDNTIALNAAKTAGVRTVIIDEDSDVYLMKTTFSFVSDFSIVAGRGRPQLRWAGTSSSRAFTFSGVDDSHLIGFKIDSTSPVLNDAFIVISNGSTNCSIQKNRIVNPPAAGTGAIVVSGATTRDNLIHRNRIDGSYDTGIGLTACVSNEVSFNSLFNTGLFKTRGFAIRVGEGANRNLVANNRSETSGIEGIGVYYDCYLNRIIGNHCENGGDNGISITGYQNVVADNECVGNLNSGIGIWGSFNTITGNVCINNAQTLAPPYWTTGQTIAVGDQRIYSGNLYTAASAGTTAGAGPSHATGTVADGGTVQWTYTSATSYDSGIWISVGFGGAGQFNVISGNVCDDNTASPKQYFDVRIQGAGGYTAWANAQTITANTYRVNGLNIYRSTNAGTTATGSAPTHTTGIVTGADGISWQYYNKFVGQASPRGNIINAVCSGRTKSGNQYSDAANWLSNSLIAHQQFNMAGNGAANGFSITSLPTSASGLSSGRLWNNAGVVNVIP